MAELKLYLLGTPRIEYQGRGVQLSRRKALALAAFLALAEHPQSRDLLATLLWPDLDQVHARSALRSTLPALTNLVPLPWLDLDRMALALNREVVWVDVDRFRTLLAGSRSHGHNPEVVCETCAQQLHQALALYRADFMTGFSLSDSAGFDDWQSQQRKWLSREQAGVLRRLSTYCAAQGQVTEALDNTRRWLETD